VIPTRRLGSARALIVAGLLSASLVGCLRARSVERNYFILESGAAGAPVQAPAALPGRVYVRDCEVDRVYDKFELVVRKSRFVLQYSSARRWAVRPNRMVSDLLADELTHQGIFSSVSRELAEGRPEYSLSGRLRAIEVETAATPWRAHVALDLSLIRFDDGAVLWRRAFDERRNIPPGELDAVPEALSSALHVSIRRALEDLRDAAPALQVGSSD